MNPVALPAAFFKGVKAIESFSEDSVVYFHEGILKSNKRMENASTYKIEGLPQGFAFNAKYLLMLEFAMKTVAFKDVAKGCKAYFFAENVRGVLMGVSMNNEERREYETNGEVQGRPKPSQPQSLGAVAKALLDAKLRGKNLTSTKLFKKFPQHFALLPPEKPRTVQYIAPLVPS